CGAERFVWDILSEMLLSGRFWGHSSERTGFYVKSHSRASPGASFEPCHGHSHTPAIAACASIAADEDSVRIPIRIRDGVGAVGLEDADAGHFPRREPMDGEVGPSVHFVGTVPPQTSSHGTTPSCP